MASRSINLSLIVFLGLSLGLILAQIGLFFKPFLAYFLTLLMFFTCLKIDLADFRRINIRTIFVALFLVFVFMPLLSLIGILFSPLIFTGILLAFSCPTAVATAFFSDALKGNPSLAIVLTTITSLISIVTLPITMLIGVGMLIKFDAISMILSLIQIVLVPLSAAILIRRYFRKISDDALKYGNFVSNMALILILWGGVASGVSYIQSNIYDFLGINLVITFLLTIVILVSYNMGRIFGRKDAITLTIATLLKNSVLALVIGIITFGSGVLPALVAHLIDQNILLIPLGLFLKGK
ncbi:MAG: bile acid:sodium symporter [Nitrososphaerales archaeon]